MDRRSPRNYPFPFIVGKQPKGEPPPTCGPDFGYQLRGFEGVTGYDDGIYQCVPNLSGAWDDWERIGGAGDEEMIPGTIVMWPVLSTPSGWLLCDGQAVPRASVLGTLLVDGGMPFGDGDGSTTVNLPDLRDRFVIGKGANAANNVVGETGGDRDVTLTAAQSGVPAHTHDFSGHTHTTVDRDQPGANTASVGSAATITTAANAAADAAASHTNMPPFLALQFIIKE